MTSEEPESVCTICMEEWTIGTEHRICCLKCGHLFGRSCIERWLKEKGTPNAKCPTCNKPAKKADLRDLWCKATKAVDSTELKQIQDLLDHERKLRKQDSAIIFHNNMKLEMLEEANVRLKKEVIDGHNKIAKLEAALNTYIKSRAQGLELDISAEEQDSRIEVDVVPQQLRGRFHFDKKVDSSSTGNCKSFTICPSACLLLVAQEAPRGSRALMDGFGIRKYSVIDTNVREYVHLHGKMINSIQMKPVGDIVLTSSQDKKVKLTSINSNTCIQTYNCTDDPVCVNWSANRDQQFYVASGNCFVSLYDMRNTSEYIYQTARIARSRLLSIASTTEPSGLLVNDCKGTQFLELSDSSDYDNGSIDREVQHLSQHPLPFAGLMGTVDYDKKLNVALITTRKSQNNAKQVHSLVKLAKSEEAVSCNGVRTFEGGIPPDLLSQSRILKHPTLDEHVLVCASDSDSKGIKIWDSSDSSVYQTIRTSSFVRDTLMYSPENTNQHVLYTLSSEEGLSIYMWDSV